MKLSISCIDDIKKYNPYGDLFSLFEDEYFEVRFLEYLNDFYSQINNLKESFSHEMDEDIDVLVKEIIRKRNDEQIKYLIDYYRITANTADNNKEHIAKFKEMVRKIKDLILASEPSDMDRLAAVDQLVGNTIDEVSISLGLEKEVKLEDFRTDELVDIWINDEEGMLSKYYKYVDDYRCEVDRVCQFCRDNFSLETASDHIKKLHQIRDDNLEYFGHFLGFASLEYKEIDKLVDIFDKKEVDSSNYDKWIADFRLGLEQIRNRFTCCYSFQTVKVMDKYLDKVSGLVLDKKAATMNMDDVFNRRLEEIFENYKPQEIDIFDVIFYDSLDDREKAYKEYFGMTEEAKRVFEMRIYDQYIRLFKCKIRDLNSDVRRIYSKKYADKKVNIINKKADNLVCSVAKKIGKPVPKNPWIIRKYLWADTENFISDRGIKFRKSIKPALSGLVRVAMNNKLIIEERPKLDPTKQYVFVSTHYFTEDVIGLFSSIERQAFMLMGTTDQIENNPLMLAACAFGFFHVDRMDPGSRKQCLTKQNNIIDHGADFINYVSGSWENSENELQPLSFSGPYRTSIAKGVQIVPIASYLVRERKEVYFRYGEPLDLSMYDEDTANMIIRDTLATMHFKQMSKHGVPIETIEVTGYGKTHNLPYDQHTYYMNLIGNEYWNQFWSKPFAKEEIGTRTKKSVDETDVYAFVDNLSRDKLIELSDLLAEPLVHIEEKTRFDIIRHIDDNYDWFRKNNTGKKKKKRVKEK